MVRKTPSPVAENGGLDHHAAELPLEWLAQARRHTDVKENLHARESGEGGAVGIAGCGGADGRMNMEAHDSEGGDLRKKNYILWHYISLTDDTSISYVRKLANENWRN